MSEQSLTPESFKIVQASTSVPETSGIKEDSFAIAINMARDTAEKALVRASSLQEFMMYTNAVRGLVPNSLEWAREGSEARSSGEWFSDFVDEPHVSQFETEAGRAVELVGKLDPSKQTDKVQVVVTRINSEGSGYPDYRAVAVFPDNLAEPVSYDLSRLNVNQRDVFYMRLSQACNQQAIDEILGENSVASYEIDNLSPLELRERLGIDVSFGPQQNFKYRDATGNVTGHRDERLYVLNSLKGGFSNEEDRFLISDFSMPQQPQEASKT